MSLTKRLDRRMLREGAYITNDETVVEVVKVKSVSHTATGGEVVLTVANITEPLHSKTAEPLRTQILTGQRLRAFHFLCMRSDLLNAPS